MLCIVEAVLGGKADQRASSEAGVCTGETDKELPKSTLHSTSGRTYSLSLIHLKCLELFVPVAVSLPFPIPPCVHSALPCRNLPVAGHVLGHLGV